MNIVFALSVFYINLYISVNEIKDSFKILLIKEIRDRRNEKTKTFNSGPGSPKIPVWHGSGDCLYISWSYGQPMKIVD
jgi:hypothetical protein